MIVDEQATVKARARQQLGRGRLRRLFSPHKTDKGTVLRRPELVELIRSAGIQTGKAKPPARTKPGCPRPRTAAQKARRLARKTSRQSRKDNR